MTTTTTTQPIMQKEEGKVTTKIEEKTGKVPSGAYLGLAIGSMVLSAGIMLAGEGLQASSKGARIYFNGDKRTVVDGPFTETKELVAGYWIWKCKSLAEAIEWARRCPNPTGAEGQLEIRQIFELDDFGPELTPELRQKEEQLYREVERQQKKQS